MLYAIRTERWISGIFERESDARDYLKEIPEALCLQHTLLELPDLQYPVYLVEDYDPPTFRFMTEAAAVEDIKNRLPRNDDEGILTLYRIDRDYRPSVPGEDQMGLLNHEHIDNDILERVQRDGRAGLGFTLEEGETNASRSR